MIVRRHLWVNWCREFFKDKINSHYLKRKSQLDRVTYSLLRIKDQDLANELFLDWFLFSNYLNKLIK